MTEIYPEIQNFSPFQQYHLAIDYYIYININVGQRTINPCACFRLLAILSWFQSHRNANKRRCNHKEEMDKSPSPNIEPYSYNLDNIGHMIAGLSIDDDQSTDIWLIVLIILQISTKELLIIYLLVMNLMQTWMIWMLCKYRIWTWIYDSCIKDFCNLLIWYLCPSKLHQYHVPIISIPCFINFKSIPCN